MGAARATPQAPLVAEYVNPDFDARLVEKFDSPELLRVYADWLEERGDPRAQLIRLHFKISSDEARGPWTEHGRGSGLYFPTTSAARYEAKALVSDCWVRWFGDVPPEFLELVWEHGFVRRLKLRARLASPFRSLAVLPALRFVGQLDVSRQDPGGTMDGLEELRALQWLSWTMSHRGALEPLAGRELPSLAEWQLRIADEPTDADLEGLHSVRVPRLKRLRLELPPSCETRLVECLSRAPWYPSLEQLRLTLTTRDATQTLVTAPTMPFQAGWGLTLCLPEHVLASLRDTLARVVPHARFEVGPEGRRERLDGSA